jgi:lipoprotein-anchoring transpeptidase ErfK/SrfK
MRAMTQTRLAAVAVVACALIAAVPAVAQDAPATETTPSTETAPAPTPTAPVVTPKPKPAAKLVVPTPPNARSAWIATLHRAVSVRVAPKNGARQRVLLQPTAPFAGGLTELLVTRSVVRDGEVWIEVLLPMRPNGVRGWIHSDFVTLKKTPFRVEIDIGDRRLRIYKAGRRVLTAKVGVGKVDTPTPLGRFAIAETVVTNHPGGFLGPIVLPITGYSKVLNEFAGGDGRVAIHGTSVPSLIGGRVSHGCVRMYNRDIVRVARMAQPGTPLLIKA